MVPRGQVARHRDAHPLGELDVEIEIRDGVVEAVPDIDQGRRRVFEC